MNFKCQSSFDVCESSGNKAKITRDLPLYAPTRHHEGQRKKSLFGIVAACFSVHLWKPKEVNASGNPGTRPHSHPLDCALVLVGAGEMQHSDGAIHHTSTHHKWAFSQTARVDIQEQSNNNVWGIVLKWSMKKSRQMHPAELKNHLKIRTSGWTTQSGRFS